MHGTVKNGIYTAARHRYENMSRHSAQPIIQSHVNVTTSMVKAFQQQALLCNTLMSMPVFLGEKNPFNPCVTAVENEAKFLH